MSSIEESVIVRQSLELLPNRTDVNKNYSFPWPGIFELLTDEMSALVVAKTSIVNEIKKSRKDTEEKKLAIVLQTIRIRK